MTSEAWLALVLAGLGTYLIRYLPLRHAAWLLGEGEGKDGGERPLTRALAAIGPAAVVALTTLSLFELARPAAASGTAQGWLALALGGLAVWLVHRLSGAVALATLAGALVYGLCWL